MTGKWTIELTSDQVQGLLEALEAEHDQLTYYPPREDHAPEVHEAYKHSITVNDGLLELLMRIRDKIKECQNERPSN